MELKNFFAQDLAGNVIPNPTVTVKIAGSSTLATGLQDAAGNSLTNPFYGAVTGQVTFAAPNGSYDLTVEGLSRTLSLQVDFFDGLELATGGGAAEIGITDSGGFFPSTMSKQIEAALAELAKPTGQMRHRGLNVLRYIPPALWPGIQDRTGTTDVSTYINTALASLVKTFDLKEGQTVTAKAGAVYLPEGRYPVSAQVLLQSAYGVEIFGDGEFATQLYPIATFSGAVLSLQDCHSCTVSNLGIYCPTTAPGGDAITVQTAIESVQNNALSVISPSRNLFSHVNVQGNGVLADGFLVTYTSTDAGNDFHRWEHSTIGGYTFSGVHFVGYQTHLNEIVHCDINGLNAAQTAALGSYGIYAASSGTNCASFCVDGGAIGGHAVADYYIGGGAVNAFNIKNVSSENSYRLLVTANNAGNPCGLLENVRFASDAMAADGYAIQWQLAGTLTLEGGQIGTNGTTSAAQPTIQLSSSTSITLRARGTRFGWWQTGNATIDSTGFSPVVMSGSYTQLADIKLEGCIFQNARTTTQAAYRRFTGALASSYSINAYHGEVSYNLAATGAHTLARLLAAYPNQEVTLVLENTSTTVTHNAGGAGAIMLKSGANFTPTVAPYAMKLRYNDASGRWMEI